MPLFPLLISMFCFFATEGIFAQQNHPFAGGMPQVDGGYVWIISYHDLLTNQTKQLNGMLILTR